LLVSFGCVFDPDDERLFALIELREMGLINAADYAAEVAGDVDRAIEPAVSVSASRTLGRVPDHARSPMGVWARARYRGRSPGARLDRLSGV
jgi:hypothetical protein